MHGSKQVLMQWKLHQWFTQTIAPVGGCQVLFYRVKVEKALVVFRDEVECNNSLQGQVQHRESEKGNIRVQHHENQDMRL